MTTTLLLPGQAAAPEGPADLSMMYVLHHGFRRDLARFLAAARLTPTRDRATWQALQRRWELFGLLLHDHHHKEDEILWPLLEGKVAAAGDSEAAQVLAAMEAEHALIDPLLEEVGAGLARLAAAEDPEGAAALVASLEQTRQVLGGHLAHEESDAIAVMQRYVGGQEWEHLERTRFRGGLGPADVLRMVPWAVQDLPPAVAARMLEEAGAGFRLMLRLGRRRYERLDRAAFAHVPDHVGAG
jgi:hypothetical protein